MIDEILEIEYEDISERVGTITISEAFVFANLAPNLKVLEMALRTYAWGRKNSAKPSVKTLSHLLDINERNIRKQLKTLEKKGRIEIKPRKGTSNLYIIKKITEQMYNDYLNKKESGTKLSNLKDKTPDLKHPNKKEVGRKRPGVRAKKTSPPRAKKTHEAIHDKLNRNFPPPSGDGNEKISIPSLINEKEVSFGKNESNMSNKEKAVKLALVKLEQESFSGDKPTKDKKIKTDHSILVKEKRFDELTRDQFCYIYNNFRKEKLGAEEPVPKIRKFFKDIWEGTQMLTPVDFYYAIKVFFMPVFFEPVGLGPTDLKVEKFYWHFADFYRFQ